MRKKAVETAVSVLDMLEPHVDRLLVRLLVVYPFAVVGWIFGLTSVASTEVSVTVAAILGGGYYMLALVYVVLRAFRWKHALKNCRAVNATLTEGRDRFANRVALIQSANPNYFLVHEWDEHVRVGKFGDATIVREVSLVAGPEGMDVFFAGLFSSAIPEDQTLITAAVEVVRESSSVPCVSEIHWVGPNRLRVYSFLTRHHPAGESLKIRITFEWPRYWVRLAENARDSMIWTVGRPIGDLKFVMVIERGSGLPEQVALDASAGKPELKTWRDREGNLVIQCLASDLATGEELGFNLVPQ